MSTKKSKNAKKTYRGRSPVKTVFKTLFITVLVLVILFVGVFFYFQRYIVYENGGLRLDVPFLDRETREVSASPSPSPTPRR